MIPYIDERLVDWARWSVSDGMEIRNSLGSRNCWPQMVRDPDSTDTVAQTGSLVPCNDIECAEMDEAVCSLPSELKSIIWDFYKRTVSGDQIAKRLGIGKRTLYDRIDYAHNLLATFFYDRASAARRQADIRKNLLSTAAQKSINPAMLV